MYDDDNVWSIDSTFHNPYNFSSVAPTLSPIECSNEHSKIIETSPFSISFLVQSLASQISSFKISQIIVPTFTRRSTFRYRSNFPTNIVHKTAKQLLPLNQFQKQAISSNPSANTSITFSIIKRSNLIRNVLSDKSWNNVLPKKKKKEKPRGSSRVPKSTVSRNGDEARDHENSESRDDQIDCRGSVRFSTYGFPSRLTLQGTGKNHDLGELESRLQRD